MPRFATNLHGVQDRCKLWALVCKLSGSWQHFASISPHFTSILHTLPPSLQPAHTVPHKRASILHSAPTGLATILQRRPRKCKLWCKLCASHAFGGGTLHTDCISLHRACNIASAVRTWFAYTPASSHRSCNAFPPDLQPACICRNGGPAKCKLVASHGSWQFAADLHSAALCAIHMQTVGLAMQSTCKSVGTHCKPYAKL